MLLLLVLSVVLVVRFPFLFRSTLGYDAGYHAQAAITILKGGLLYRDVPYTYPPLYAYSEAAAIAILGNTALSWKATAQIYDLGIVALVFTVVNRISGRNSAFATAALYGFSPLPFFATSSFASFDSTAVFWMLLSLLLLLKKRPIASAVSLGVGTAYKYFPLLLLPVALVHLSTNRQKVCYATASLATVAVIQLPFILTEFNAWFGNAILYHLNRPAFGATIYNLLSLHPQLMEMQTPLTILSPITLLLIILLAAFSEGKTELGLLKSSAMILVAGVFFSKVVLFYALWYIPLICILIVALRQRVATLILIPLISLQTALLLGWYTYQVSGSIKNLLTLTYVYLGATGLLLFWLVYDRLIFARTLPFKKLRMAG